MTSKTPTTPKTEAPTVALGLQAIEIGNLVPRKGNRSKSLTGGEDPDFVDSIRRLGVLLPLLVRHLEDGRYEIMAGERRFNAAQLVGLEEVPCRVLTASDAAAEEIRLVENLQRRDLHWLEEAQGFHALHHDHGIPFLDLAAEVHKSASYVAQRVRLARLPKKVQDLILKNEAPVAIAIELARLGDPGQIEKAAREIFDRRGDLDPDDVRDLIAREYHLSLDQGGFDPEDPDLVPAAGKCSACPKRTGNQGALFADIKSGNLCTDPGCFTKKRDAVWRRESEAAKKRGLQVLSDREASRTFGQWDSAPAYNSKWADLEAHNYDDDKNRTYRKILGKPLEDLPVALARDRQGRTRVLVAKKDLPRLLKEAGFKKATLGATRSVSNTDRARKRKVKINTIAARAAIRKIVELLERKDPGPKIWDAILEGIFEGSWHDAQKEVIRARELTARSDERTETTLRKAASTMTGRQKAALAVEILMTRSMPANWTPEFGDTLKAVAKTLRVDLQALARQADKDNPQRQPKGAKKKARRGKKTATRRKR